MSDIKIHHYKRANAIARSKELVAELVSEDSATGRFLERLERMRESKPCYLTIDMRGKVPGECTRQSFNNREFYLDQISYGIFQYGLKEHNGVFTIGTYEAIVNGEHTNRAIRERELRGDGQDKSLPGSTEKTNEKSAIADKEETPDNPYATIFGYYQKRTEPRLNYVTLVELICGQKSLIAKTRDVSTNGICIGFKEPIVLKAGQRIVVSFSALHEKLEKPFLLHIPYQLIRQKWINNETRLMLKLGGPQHDHPIRQFFQDFVEKHRLRYKYETEDLFTETNARLYERIYTNNLSGMPFYVGSSTEGKLIVQHTAITDGNLPLAQFFSNNREHLDLTPLCLPHRLQQLQESGKGLLILYRTADGCQSIHSATEVELETPKALKRFIRFALSQPEYCFVKAIVRLVAESEQRNELLDACSERIATHSSERADEFRTNVASITAVGMLYDVTDELSQMVQKCEASDLDPLDTLLPDLTYWEHTTRRNLSNNEVCEKLDRYTPSAPNTTVFGYREQRREPRYFASTRISVHLDGKVYEGETIDISPRGLCIKLDMDPSQVHVLRGDELRVHLVSLQKKRTTLNLKAVPYQVMNIERKDQLRLGVERLSEKNYHEITGFFNEVIETNRHKLKQDISEITRASAAVVYAQMLCDSHVSIPFFIGKKDDEPPFIQAVAITSPPSELTTFLMNENKEYDFRFLARRSVVRSLYLSVSELKRAAVRENKRPPPYELEVYLWKSTEENGTIQSICTADFESAKERDEFMAELMLKKQFRIVKLIASYAAKINDSDFDDIVELMRNSSRYRAAQLESAIRQVICIGDLVDITDDVIHLVSSPTPN